MKIKLIIALFTVVFINTLNSQVVAELDKSASKLTFIIRHNMKTAYEGSFKEFSGNAQGSGKGDYKNATFTVTAMSNSIKTKVGNEEMLKSKDYLDAANYPQVTFVLDSVDMYNESINQFVTHAVITIKNISKPIKMKAYLKEDLKKFKESDKVSFKLVGHIDADDFGLPHKQGMIDPVTKKEIGEEIVIDYLLVYNKVKQ